MEEKGQKVWITNIRSEKGMDYHYWTYDTEKIKTEYYEQGCVHTLVKVNQIGQFFKGHKL